MKSSTVNNTTDRSNYFCIYIIFIHTCIPTQNAIINLWAEMAKQRYQTTLALPSVPIAMPSNIACREMAKTTINPRKAALKMRKVRL